MQQDPPDPKPFELEDEPEDSGYTPSARPVEDTPVREEGEVDTRTVAERRGQARPRDDAILQRPEGWPIEALRFPLRPPGPMLVLVGTALFAGLDILGTAWPDVRFLFLVGKLGLVWLIVHTQLTIAAEVAAGADRPVGWRRSTRVEGEDIWRTSLFVVLLGVYSVPGLLLWQVWEKTGPGVLLLVAVSLYASVMGLGLALDDRRMKWPWHALVWIVRRPLCCLVGSLGWWCLVLTEPAIRALDDVNLLVMGFVAVVLRAVGFYMLLVSARALGVMGRAWHL